MDDSVRRGLELLALQLAVIVVAAHLWWALRRLVEQLRGAPLHDPRPILFVLASMGIIMGIVYVALGGRRVPVYALGIVLMAVFFVGYWAFHVFGHLPALPWVPGEPLVYDDNPFRVLVDHLRHDTHALVSKTAEVALAAVLGILLYAEFPEGEPS